MASPCFFREVMLGMRKRKSFIIAFVSPCVLAVLVMYLYPIIRTAIMTFFAIDSVTADVSKWTFNGVDNYVKIFTSPTFQRAMSNIFLIWLVGGIFVLAFALLFAVIGAILTIIGPNLLSQITNLLTTIVAGNVPDFEILTLVLMVCGGIGGGMIGRFFSRRMDNRAVDKLFIGLMVVIMGISVWNTCRYSGIVM